MSKGWKCKIGYMISGQNNINQATFTDEGFWILPEFPAIIGTLSYKDLSEMIADMESSIGNDFYVCYAYGFPSRFDDFDSGRWSFMIPSILKMAPNLISAIKSGVALQRSIVYIPGLKRVIAGYSNGQGRGYKLDENGYLVEIGDNRQNQFSITSHCTKGSPYPEQVTCYGILKGTNDLSAPSNYCYLSAVSFQDGCQWSISELSSYQGVDAYKEFWSDYVNPDVEDLINPYEPGGPSKPYDPTVPGFIPGTFDEKSDPIPDSPLPTLSAANTGFTRIYNPTLDQVQDLARYLWTDETVIQTIWNHIKQYFEDPMQAIIGFNLVPCSVPNAGSQSFALMYIDTGVSMNVAANQFVDVDCGSVKLERFYGSALDQSPHTRVSCFLPYIGTIRLNTDEVMGTTLQVKYRIDICSGSCVAKILVDGNCLYQYSGHCAINIPISSADFSSYVSSAITVARLATGAAVGGVAGLGTAAVSDPEQQTDRVVTVDRTTTTTARNPATGRQITTGTRHTLETKTIPMKQSHTQASFNALSPENVSNTVGQIMASKPLIEHTGSFSGNTGYLGVRRPFLIIERPNMCLPEQYQHFNGYPSMITMELSTCKGFTRIQQVELTGMTATNPEQAEILSLLKSGVYF